MNSAELDEPQVTVIIKQRKQERDETNSSEIESSNWNVKNSNNLPHTASDCYGQKKKQNGEKGG